MMTKQILEMNIVCCAMYIMWLCLDLKPIKTCKQQKFS